MNFKRLLKHLLLPDWLLRRHFPAATLAAIERAIADSEVRHTGELRFVVEGALHPSQLLRGVSARERALEVFSALRVWDTEANNGVLIYLLLADRDVEIVADRGCNHSVSPAQWEAICQEMEQRFRRGEFEAGALAGIRLVDELLRRHFPASGDNPDELPNRPLRF
jgi:uncharacterized membrane protein